jgi:putative solute:sodium symporter small subunit
VSDKTKLSEKQRAYWQKNTKLIRNLLIIWALVSYGAAILLAVPFSGIQFFGVSLAFWFAQQGSILVFIGLIWYYAVKMDKLDKEFGAKEVILNNPDGNGGSVH